jgi:short-subunit dehydrogenase involved in D-alanine esterification of teichoic acids
VFAPDRLDGREVLLLGGGSGLAPAIAQEMTAVGTLVVIGGRRDLPVRETVAASPRRCCRAEVCDVCEEDHVDPSGAIVAEARSNGDATERAST